MEELFNVFLESLEIKEVDVKTYSPLSLAYVGDTVYDFFVKYYLVLQGNRGVNEFHNRSKKFVKASEQAAILEKLTPILTEEELRVVKWGRNAKSVSSPKHADRSDYQKATSFECLLGYLLLSKSYERLMFIIVEGIKHGKANADSH